MKLDQDEQIYYEIEYYINRMLKALPYAPISIRVYEKNNLLKFYIKPKLPNIIFKIIQKHFELYYWLTTPYVTRFRIRIQNIRDTDKTILITPSIDTPKFIIRNPNLTCPLCNINIYPIRKIKSTSNKRINKLNMTLHIRDHFKRN